VLRDAPVRLGQALALTPRALRQARAAPPLRLDQAPHHGRRGRARSRSRRRPRSSRTSDPRPVDRRRGAPLLPGRELAGSGPRVRRARRARQGRPRARARRGSARQGRGREGAPRSQRAAHLRRGRPTSARSQGTTSRSRSTRDPARRRARARRRDAHVRDEGRIARRRRSLDTGEILALARPLGTTRTTTPTARSTRDATGRHRPLRARLGHEGRSRSRRPRGRHAEADRDDLLRARRYKLGGITIHDTHLNDWLTPTQILAKLEHRRAEDRRAARRARLYAAFRRFGFGEPTGLPLPGEARGVLRPKGRPWYDARRRRASSGRGSA
jgi:hypothetical protein